MMLRSRLVLSARIVSGASTRGSSASWEGASPNQTQNVNTVLGASGEVNLNAIPSTIPGITREELAARLRNMETTQRKKTLEDHKDSLAKQIDTMRRAMPPDQFKEFLRTLEEKEAASMEEAEKMSQMTPTQLYRYQLKKQRRENFYQWLNLFALFAVFVLGIYFLFYFLLFFFY